MRESLYELETLQIESECLASLIMAVHDAMEYSPNAQGNYTKGLFLIFSMLDDYAEKMKNIVDLAFAERGTSNE